MDTRTRRPDLERLPVAQRPMYLTPMLFPLLPRGQRQGTLYYSDIISDVAAETGRTAGDAPSENTISDQQTSFNLENDEFIDREKIPDADIAGLGGLAPAQQKAARKGKRAVGNSVEDLTVANILNNGDVTYHDIGTSLIDDLLTGYQTLLDYEGDGPVVLVSSSRVIGTIKQYTEVVERMKFTGVQVDDVKQVRAVRGLQLAGCLDVDNVLEGNNTQWYSHSATYQDRAALVKLPTANVEPDEEVQIGRTVWFSPTGLVPAESELYNVHTWYSENKIAEMCDVRAYAEQHVLNPELIYGLKGVDSGPTS